MPKLQRFEGINAEEVRARVLQEVGPEVAIVRAGRERSGGVLGFFEKEMFVLEVAVPDENGEYGELSGQAPSSTAHYELSALEAVAEQTNDVVSISPGCFAETLSNVLEEAAATLAGSGEAPFAERSPNESIRARPAPVISSAAAKEACAGSPARHLRAWNRRGAAEAQTGLLAPPARETLGRREAGLRRNAAYSPSPPPRQAPMPQAPMTRAPLAPAPMTRAPMSAPPPMTRAPLTPALMTPPPMTAPEAEPTSDAELLLAALADLGVPCPALLPESSRLDHALLQVLTSLALPAPHLDLSKKDSALVVFGKRLEAKRLASLLRAKIGAGDDAVLTVSLRARPSRATGVLTSPLAAAQMVSVRRVLGQPSVLAVEIDAEHVSMEALRRLIFATRAEATWAALPATTRLEELKRLTAFTGDLDAIALYDLERAERPAEILAAGVPIAYLDWHEASPLMWSARLFERLSADAGH